MTRLQAEQTLKSTFGFNHFHDNQWIAIEKNPPRATSVND
jgi:hypothetical protein